MDVQGNDVFNKYIFSDEFRNVASSGVINKDIVIEAKKQDQEKYFTFTKLILHYVHEDLVLTVRFDSELLLIDPQKVTGDLFEVVAISALDNS
jgi:hypothetical protein